ncbi:MAG: M60 family metallopeptidase [Rhodospirillaceae bacterium]|nr:M60 family metallopeptidase [Rhodospirillaceae bacterium]
MVTAMALATLVAMLPAGPAAAQTIVGSATPTADVDGGYGPLLDGVTQIGAPGLPGPLCVYGPAFPVIVGATRGGARAPVVAASRWRAGRVVALGHGGYFQRATLETADTGRLLTNALGWAAGEEAQASPRIGVVVAVGAAHELLDWLMEAGQDAVETQLTPQSLGAVDVVALEVWNQSESELNALSAFVRAGGGLVTASTAWGWADLHPDLDLVNDYAGNRLLAPIGLQWPYDWLHRTSPKGYSVDGPPPELTHAGAAIEAVEAHVAGSRALNQQEIDQATDTLLRAAGCLPPDDTLLAPRLHALTENNDHWPSTERPVGTTDVIPRLAAKLFVIAQRRTPPESVRAHPAAVDFPGSVPADASRVTRNLTIDTDVSRWHSTGLYAAPGELVMVTLPAEAAETGGFHVRVGAHSDDISIRPEWTRMPEISRRFSISAATTRVANAFGGLIYVEVPADADLGTIAVEIQGAVAAPRFVLGETDPADWRDEIRHAPASWAEIEGRNMIVTTDAREVRGLDNPAAVARVWDRVLDLNAELAAGLRAHAPSPERFVVDRQISVGWMHSGYPLMAHMAHSAYLVDAQHLSTCRQEWTGSNWGFYHEVGHNHQSDDWTFDGTGEVTVNLFTLYVYEFLCGIVPTDRFPGSDKSWAEEMARYDFDDPDFELWKRHPFLALIMYAQMQQAFGWEAYRQVFATYRTLPGAERPKSDDEKRDQWLVRFSRQVGRNLGPFFEAWGVPTSRAARDSIADLPAWLPPDFPPVDINLPPHPVGTLTSLRIGVDKPAVTVDVMGAFRDPDGDALTYAATSSAPGVAAVAVSGDRVTVRPVATGTATITVTATDAGGSNTAATQTFTVEVVRVAWTDDPIRPGVTVVKAVHFTELRSRIDGLRQAAGLQRFAWTDPVLTAGATPIRLLHLLELRTALVEAFTGASRTVPDWTDPVPVAGTTPMRAAHLVELRAAVMALESGSR